MRYFMALLAAFLLIVLLLILLLHSTGNSRNPVATRALSSYATTDSEVIMTIDGPVNAEQNHRQVRVSVDVSSVTLQQVQGYNNDVVNQRVFGSSPAAYNVFLHALAHAGFTKGKTGPGLNSELGYCPLGTRYIFELRENGQDIKRYWTTSCGSPKTYLGATNLTVSLFQAQVPDYSTLNQNFSLSLNP